MSASTAPSVPELQGPAAVRGWQAHRAEVDRRLGPCFRRSESRQRAAAYLDGLLSDTRRKNGWQLAETAGDATPYGFQHLLGRAVWSADAARDELYAYVSEHLGDSEAVVVIDQLGFPKKGEHSAGVARQYCGTLGQVANCQVGVFLAYAGARGHTLLDRELYLPEAWTDDGARLQAVGLAPDTPFATKPQLAQRMLARVLEAEVPVAWVTGDTVYGRSATCVAGWRTGACTMCWRCRATSRCGLAGTIGPRRRCTWSMETRNGIGSVPARGARTNAGTTGSAGC